MPSQRKRIGFLPHADVQEIIDQICEHNKLSQSKVTGILVEEALCSRGVLNRSVNRKILNLGENKDKSIINDEIFNNEVTKENDKFPLDKSNIKDELKMINDFIEYKFFKNIMNKNKNNI